MKGFLIIRALSRNLILYHASVFVSNLVKYLGWRRPLALTLCVWSLSQKRKPLIETGELSKKENVQTLMVKYYGYLNFLYFFALYENSLQNQLIFGYTKSRYPERGQFTKQMPGSETYFFEKYIPLGIQKRLNENIWCVA